MSNEPEMQGTMYIGDGVYVKFDKASDIWIYTYDGIKITNRICMEPEVLRSFLMWMKKDK